MAKDYLYSVCRELGVTKEELAQVFGEVAVFSTRGFLHTQILRALYRNVDVTGIADSLKIDYSAAESLVAEAVGLLRKTYQYCKYKEMYSGVHSYSDLASLLGVADVELVSGIMTCKDRPSMRQLQTKLEGTHFTTIARLRGARSCDVDFELYEALHIFVQEFPEDLKVSQTWNKDTSTRSWNDVASLFGMHISAFQDSIGRLWRTGDLSESQYKVYCGWWGGFDAVRTALFAKVEVSSLLECFQQAEKSVSIFLREGDSLRTSSPLCGLNLFGG